MVDNKHMLEKMLSLLVAGEKQTNKTINLVASENILSPLAKLPFLLELSSRYYLDDMRRFGKWCFPAGKSIGKIEEEILIPMLENAFAAKFINVRPISGMNCMTIALGALTSLGNAIFSISPENGGHVSTEVIANRLGLRTYHIPFLNPYDVHLDHLETLLTKVQPAMVYIDQSNLLFPLDQKPIRDLIDSVSPKTILYYDSSHINGLIIGKATFNPLVRGAHILGGSTHKTLPGPHKGFLATNDHLIARKIQQCADHFVSHHHPASILSLTITLLEMLYCDGQIYAKQVINNSKAFAKTLAHKGFYVAAAERGYTESHQIWAYPIGEDIDLYFERLVQAGITANRFNCLPGIKHPALRLSLTEITKLGAKETDANYIALLLSELLTIKSVGSKLIKKIQFIHKKLSKPQYCFNHNVFDQSIISDELKEFLLAN